MPVSGLFFFFCCGEEISWHNHLATENKENKLNRKSVFPPNTVSGIAFGNYCETEIRELLFLLFVWEFSVLSVHLQALKKPFFFDSLFSYFACFHLITSTFFYKVVSDDSLWSDPCEVLTQITFQFHLNVVGFVAAGTNSRDVFVVSAALKQLLFIQKWDDNWEWVQIVCSRACLWVFNVEIVFLKIQFTPIFFLFFSKHYFFFTSLLIFKPAVIIVLATGSTNKLLAQHLQFIKNTNHLQLLVCKFIRLIQQTTWR